MRRHFDKIKTCSAKENDIVLTDDIKQHILDNHEYRVKRSDHTVVKKLRDEIMFLKDKKNEVVFQRMLEKLLGGGHKRLPSGVTDITTDEFHAEIKNWDGWKEAVGQLLVYNSDDERKELRLYFFGKEPGQKCKENVLRKLKHFKICPFFVSIDKKDLSLVCVPLFALQNNESNDVEKNNDEEDDLL